MESANRSTTSRVAFSCKLSKSSCLCSVTRAQYVIRQSPKGFPCGLDTALGGRSSTSQRRGSVVLHDKVPHSAYSLDFIAISVYKSSQDVDSYVVLYRPRFPMRRLFLDVYFVFLWMYQSDYVGYRVHSQPSHDQNFSLKTSH